MGQGIKENQEAEVGVGKTVKVSLGGGEWGASSKGRLPSCSHWVFPKLGDKEAHFNDAIKAGGSGRALGRT